MWIVVALEESGLGRSWRGGQCPECRGLGGRGKFGFILREREATEGWKARRGLSWCVSEIITSAAV